MTKSQFINKLSNFPKKVGLPIGYYTAKLIKWDHCYKKHGPYYNFTFQVAEELGYGRQFDYIVQDQPLIDDTKLLHVVESLLGRELGDDESITYDSLIGRYCQLIISIANPTAKSKNNYNYIDDVEASKSAIPFSSH